MSIFNEINIAEMRMTVAADFRLEV